MENEVVVREGIHENINKLMEINSEIPESAVFQNVKEKSGPFKHKVTGEEMNSLIKQLQTEFKEQNRRDILTFEELKKIYAAISVLDNDYIKKLVDSAESMKVLKDKVDEIEGVNFQLSEKIKEVVSAQNLILDKFSSFDNVLLLEELRANQEKEIEILTAEKKTLNITNEEYRTVIGSLKQKITVLSISLGVVGVACVTGVVLNILGVI